MTFGTPPPVDKTVMVYAIRSARCGHIVDVVVDVAKNSAAEVADRLSVIPFVVEVERMSREQAQAEAGSCGACRPPEQEGLGL